MPSLTFNDSDWARMERDTLAWWRGELDRPLVYLSVTPPLDCPKPYDYQSNYPLDLPAERLVDLYEPFLDATRWYGDAFPWFWINFGPGIMAGFMGAEVNSVAEPGETVWFTPTCHLPVDQLSFQYDPNNPWWLRVKDVTRAFVERYQGQLKIGQTDLGGNLDILASFLTSEQLLTDLIDQPEAVLRQVQAINALWLRYYDEQAALVLSACRGTSAWAPLWSPGKTYMLQSDFSYMISPRMFERFVLPDLESCCAHLDHAFYHLDGKGEIPHLDLLLSLQRLRGIQWIPGDGQPTPDQWLPLLKRIRDGGKLCQVYVSPEGALRIAKHLGGKGFLFVINTFGPEFYNPEEVAGFFKALHQADSSGHL